MSSATNLATVAMVFSLAISGSTPAGAAAAGATPQPTLPKCDKVENRQFDFWIGRWKVFDTNDGSAQGDSLIEALYAGCTLRENWSDPTLTGGSLNTYSPSDHKWRQTWTDSAGSWREFVGGMHNGEMILEATFPSVRVSGATVRERMTFTHNPDGSVRQHMQTSLDNQKWTEGYDYTYRIVK